MFQPRGLRRRPETLGPPIQSIRPFKSSEHYLEAMKEDLAEWLRDLYGLDIDGASFLQVLETGLVLCRHANAITEAALAFLAEAPAQAQRIPVPQEGVSCNGAAQPGTFQARDNVSNFIQWCRKEMGIQEVLMFETEDLVLRKNVKNVVLCLLEVGRRAWRFGVTAPTLVQLEEEIEEELRRELALPPPDPPPPAPPTRRACHFRNLDQVSPVLKLVEALGQVQSLVSHCTCPVQFSMVKVSEGKYRVGNSNTLIFIRVPDMEELEAAKHVLSKLHLYTRAQMILRNHVMVRVGGGWDTLGHYLDKHDPCRCTSLSHKPGSFPKPPAPSVQHEVRVLDGPSHPQPTMTISRSQSPLPPVDWKTYTSSGHKLKPPTSSSPSSRCERGAGMGFLREMAPPMRCQERSLTPSRRQLSAGDSPPSPQSSSTHRGRDPQCTSSGKREDRHPSELLRGRTSTCWVYEETASQGTYGRAPTPQRLRVPEVTTKGTPARGPSPLAHSSSPVKSLSLGQPPWGEDEGTSLQLRESAAICSPPSTKGPTKIPIRLSPARPPTPGRGLPGTTSGASMTELERGPSSLRAVVGDRHLAGSRCGNCSVKRAQGDQKPDIQVTAEGQGLSPQEQEGRHVPLSLGRTEEQATHHSLEEEILANVKLPEAQGARPRGTGSGAIPRSGVYVPRQGRHWPEPGGLYDKVLQELAQGPPPLLKVDLGAWGSAPPESHKPAVTPDPENPKEKLGVRETGPRNKATLSDKSTTRKVPPQGGQDCSASTVSASLEVPTPLPLDLNSDKTKACPSKGKRTLRKPQRVPSIYKLKLRPRIRPRRDHRPEKQPSRIPKPLAYLCLGPARAPTRCRVSRATLGSKGGEAPAVDGDFEGKKEEEGKEKKVSATILQSRPPPPEDQRPQQLDQTPSLLEEETWV